ncbi:hypothetical protein D3C80_1564050 [compost metagenome]
MRTKARRNAKIILLPLSANSLEVPAKLCEKLSGSTSSAILSIALIPSPIVKPSFGIAETVAEM